MKRSFILISLFFFCILSFSQQFQLSLNLEKGSDYNLSSTTNTTIHQDVNGQLMKIDMMVEGVMNFFVQDIQDSQYIMQVQYKKLAMETTVRGQTMKYSSENDNEYDMMSRLLSQMTDNTFICHMQKNGSISHISGLEKMWEDILDSIPGIAETEKVQLKQQLEKAYGNEAFRYSIGLSTHIFPDDAVNMGERWWIETKLGGSMISADMECDYILAEDADDYYKILGSSYIQTDKEKSSTMNGMETQYDLSGEYNSEITINKETGWIIASNNKYFMEGEIAIKPNAQLPNGMKIPIRLNSVGLTSAD